MSFETLSHTPEFELPMNAPSAPGDLVGLIEECHEGLYRVVVAKMIRRNKYEQIAKITCQENPSKKTHPTASADDIADYCMMCMQYEADKSDDPGVYKVTLFGPPGRGRFERSKHVDFSDGEGEAHVKTMLSEGDLLEQQQTYIGELHSQMIGMVEGMNAMAANAMRENKEMMKIVSESQRRLGEVEAQRLRHELELKIHGDEIAHRQLEQEQKMERWRELLGVVKETGAFESIAKVILTKIKEASKSKNKDEGNKEEKKKKTREAPPASSDAIESRSEKAKKKAKKKRTKKKKPKEDPAPKEADDSEDPMSEEELAEVLRAEGMEKAQDNPLAVTAEILRMSIDNNDQWKIIEETLTSEQFKLFQEIMNAEDDDAIEKKLKALYKMKGTRRLLKLEKHLDEEQQKFVDILFEVAVSK